MWTPGEKKYVKAVMAWRESQETEDDASLPELRVLMIGSRGVGKTSLLRRFCTDTFAATDKPDRQFARGARRSVQLAGEAFALDILEMPSPYVDAICSESPTHYGGVDMPDDHAAALGATLTRNTPASVVLTQAVALTQAAIIVYDVTDPASFAQACTLYQRILLECRRGIDPVVAPEDDDKTQDGAPGGPAPTTTSARSSRRFPLVKLFRRSSKGSKSSDKDKGKDTQTQTQTDQSPAPEPTPPSTPTPPPPPCYSIVLVGNKSDLGDGAPSSSSRKITYYDGRQAAANIVASAAAASAAVNPSPVLAMPTAGFLETSARTGDRVTDLFMHAGRAILRQHKTLAAEVRSPASPITTNDPRHHHHPHPHHQHHLHHHHRLDQVHSALSAVSTASTLTDRKSLVLQAMPRRPSAASSSEDEDEDSNKAKDKEKDKDKGRVFGLTFRRKSAPAERSG